jgi:hypothetical protein
MIVVFVGGGLTTLLLLVELRGVLPERIVVVDPSPPLERSPVRWSYWSHQHTLYDRLAIGRATARRRARM